MHEGGEVVKNNINAIDAVADAITQIDYPDSWLNATDKNDSTRDLPEFISKVAVPCMHLKGDKLRCRHLLPTALCLWAQLHTKKGLLPTTCRNGIRPSACSVLSVRWFVLMPPSGRFCLTLKKSQRLRSRFLRLTHTARLSRGCNTGFRFIHRTARLWLVCCDMPGHALTMVPVGSIMKEEIPLLEYIQKNVSIKDNLVDRNTINGSQFHEPMLQFSGACAGCGETPYVKLVTQLMGERMVIANATGCSSIWGANYPSNAYCTNRHGHGPAWGNSLFEDNAEYGYGIASAIAHRREHLVDLVKEAVAAPATPADVKDALNAWLDTGPMARLQKHRRPRPYRHCVTMLTCPSCRYSCAI